MTSLAKQLQRLAVPHTQVILGEDRRKASLLFEPKEAASIDRETFYSLGVSGLEELMNIDDDFQQFEESLFAESSLSFERSVQTKEVNTKLDETIREFLIHLSPYCLLTPAHKSLEWLIQRYNIHLYNVDDLLLCLLPYHESKIFVRVLQLLKFDSKMASKWDWLEQLQKAGIHLASSTLINHCSSDPAFLSYICDMVPKSVKVLLREDEVSIPKSRVLFAFYTSTVIGVLEMGTISERLVSCLLPQLSLGMKSKVREYKQASYMILAQLLHNTKLQLPLLKTLQQVLAKHMVGDLLREAVSCMVLMFQTQEISDLSKKTFRYLSRHLGIVSALARLSQTFHTESFVWALIERVIAAACKQAFELTTSGESSDSESERSFLPQYLSLFHSILSNIPLSDAMAEKAALKFLKTFMNYGDRCSEIEEEELKENLQSIIRILEGRYSKAMDRAVEQLVIEEEAEKGRELVKSFLNMFMVSVQHQIVEESETSLILSLNHRLPLVRQKAVQQLIENRSQVEDVEFLKESIINRLKDEDYGVVNAVLQLGKDLWTVVDDVELVCLLRSVLQRGATEAKGYPVVEKCISILGAYSGLESSRVITCMLPYCFLTSREAKGIDIVQQIITSPVAKKSKLFTTAAADWKKKGLSGEKLDIGQANVAMAVSLATDIKKFREKNAFEMVSCWVKECQDLKQTRFGALLILLVDRLVHMIPDSDYRLKLCALQVDLVTSLFRQKLVRLGSVSDKCLSATWEFLIHHHSDGLDNLTLPEVFCIKAVQGVVTHTVVPKALEEGRTIWQWCGDESSNDVFLSLTLKIFDVLLEQAARGDKSGGTYRALVGCMIKDVFKTTKTFLKFLTLMWTQHLNDHRSDLGLTDVIQARALRIGLSQLQSLDKGISEVQNSVPVLVGLLMTLTSPHSAIRDLGIQCVQAILDKASDTDFHAAPLMKKIVRCQEEILSDPVFIHQVMSSVFRSTSLDTSSGSHSPRKAKKKKSLDKELHKCQNLSDMIGLIVDQSTPVFVQKSLLEIFSLVNNTEILTSLLPLMEGLVKRSASSLTEYEATCLNLMINRFTVETASILAPGSKSLQVYLQTLKSDTKGEHSAQTVAIQQITKELYEEIPSESQQILLSYLFDLWVEAKDVDIPNLIRRTIKHLPLDGEHISQELKLCFKTQSARSVREAKRIRRDKEDESHTEFDDNSWQRVTVILEAVQIRKKVKQYSVLIPTAFNIISRILESDSHLSAEYQKQLSLSLLYNICCRLEKEIDTEGSEVKVAERQFNMELIVNCIRSSDNPQTHHHALLLLTSAAKIYPEHLLHNMMSVFTFMGANILRQDDAYSFHVISRILETVIPALITACEQRKRVPKGISNKLEDVITMVMQVFVDSYPHIPEHRRLVLFTKLLTVVGEKAYLWRMVTLMIGLIVTKGTLKEELAGEQEASDALPPRDMEFCLELCAKFSPDIQLSSARGLIQYLATLPDDKEEAEVPRSRKTVGIPKALDRLKKDDVQLFNLATHSARQLRHFKYASIHLLLCLFTSQDFIAQIAEGEEIAILQSFQKVLETVLQYVTQVNTAANSYSHKPTAKFWKALQHKTFDLLDKLVNLLPDNMFIEVVSGLMANSVPNIQRKAMDLLNNKLQQQKEEFEEAEVSLLLPLVERLEDLVHSTVLGKESSEEVAVNGQMALISLRLLCRHLGSQAPKLFVQVLQTCVKVCCGCQDNQQVAACAMLCIAEICAALKVHVIQHLSSFMPMIMKTLKDEDNLLQNELYLLSIVTTLSKVVENLSHFLSPYIQDITYYVCMLSSPEPEAEALQKPQLQQRLKAIRQSLSTALPTRVLLPTVTACYDRLVQHRVLCINALMSTLADHISHLSREDLTSHMAQLQSYFLTSLDLRIQHSEVAETQISSVETVVIETIITMVMKLSESTFRPFLFKLYDWATRDDDYRERVLVFYRLADSLAEKLKSLFLLFAGHVITHAAKVLDLNNRAKKKKKYFENDKKSRKKSCRLLTYILDCLHKCFLYDTEGFVNKERFDTLMPALVDQLENEQGSESGYEDRVSEHLVPCIVQLAVTVQDDSLWRAINYQILLKTRHSSPKVRFAALHTVDEFHKKLGEDYMSLLPETIPFLAELMEDESEEVEKKCQSVIGQMEKTLGEPLQKYF